MKLALYAYDACPYCRTVYDAFRDLGVEYEKRDVLADPSFRTELSDAVGRSTVPVLRIEDGGDVRWMPESREIVRWLYETYGEGRKPPTRFAFHQVATFVMWALLACGMFFPEYQAPLWFSALTLGAVRSVRSAIRARSWTHAVIAVLFVFGATAVMLRYVGLASIPWWYAVYGGVFVLFVVLVIGRRASAASR